MKKFLLMCCFLVGDHSSEPCTRWRPENEARKTGLNKCKRNLSLTDDQTAKITAIYKATGYQNG